MTHHDSCEIQQRAEAYRAYIRSNPTLSEQHSDQFEYEPHCTCPALIIAGSRDITDKELIKGIMNQAWMDIGPFQVISGTARGVDQVSAAIAREAGIQVSDFPAQWDKYGKSAGYKRNAEMATFADMVLVIWDGESKGSQHMIDIADEQGKPVRVINTGESK